MSKNDVTLNVATAAKPDVQGDIARAPFADASFDEIYFEFVPFSAFSGDNIVAIRECARLLKPRGRLLIHTGRGVNIAEVMSAMQSVGFRAVRVSDRGYTRISGRTKERTA